MDGGDFQRKSADVEETPENAIGVAAVRHLLCCSAAEEGSALTDAAADDTILSSLCLGDAECGESA